eukprot:1835604-Pyramimonas_sp.AAC.2
MIGNTAEEASVQDHGRRDQDQQRRLRTAFNHRHKHPVHRHQQLRGSGSTASNQPAAERSAKQIKKLKQPAARSRPGRTTRRCPSRGRTTSR